MVKSGIEAGAVFSDFTKAFDSVPYKALIEKLQVIGLDVYLVQWITDYLTNRMQYIVVDGVSSSLSVSFPVCPRGLSWGPYFFLFLMRAYLSELVVKDSHKHPSLTEKP